MTAYAKLEKHQSYHKRQHDSAFGFNKKDEMYIYHFLIYYLFIIIYLFIFIVIYYYYYYLSLFIIIYICIILLHYFNFYSITFKFYPTKESRLDPPVSVQYHVTNSSRL